MKKNKHIVARGANDFHKNAKKVLDKYRDWC